MKLSSLRFRMSSASLWIIFGYFSIAIFTLYFVTEKYIPTFVYPFLTDPNTIKFFSTSKTMVIVQNDCELKNKIGEVYGSIAVFCSAKNKSELIPEVEIFCREGKNIIVVNKDILCEGEKCEQGSLDPLPELAEQFKYSVHITKPSTKLIPVYTGWLFNEYDSQKLLREGKSILEDLLTTVPQFSSSFKNFSGQASIKDMLKYYQLAASNANGMLHCTAKYLGNGTVPGSYQYWNKPEVKTNLGRSFGADVIGLVWTPRTFGARVRLSKEELELWGNDADNSFSQKFVKVPDAGKVPDKKEPDFSPTKGRGSRAHITIGVADGVQAVVTGEDLQEIVRLEALHQDWPTYACKLGWLRDYGAGKWVFYSDKVTTVASLFDGVYTS